jgi:hypothetical protein
MSDPIPADQLALCTLAQVKQRAHIGTIESDDLIRTLIALALKRLSVSTGREFLPWVTEERAFDVDRSLVVLDDCDLRPSSETDPLTVVLHPENGVNALTLTEGTDYELALERLTGTAGRLRLGSHVPLCSRRAAAFGHARISITGGWGIWEKLSAVPQDINEAAIECVLSWIDKAVASTAGYDTVTPAGGMPSMGASWDIPTAAYRKVQPYSRNLGVW